MWRPAEARVRLHGQVVRWPAENHAQDKQKDPGAAGPVWTEGGKSVGSQLQVRDQGQHIALRKMRLA